MGKQSGWPYSTKDTLKVILIILNTILLVFGVAALIWALVVAFGDDIDEDYPGVGDDADPVGLTVVYVLTSLCVITILICLLGYVAMYGEQRTWLLVYSSLVVLLIITAVILELFFGFKYYRNSFYFFVDIDDIDSTEDYEAFLMNSIQNDYYGSTYNNGRVVVATDSTSETWDRVHVKYECCGKNGYEDYLTSKSFHNVTYNISSAQTVYSSVPVTCCRMVDGDKFPDNPGDIQFDNLAGCLTAPTEANAWLGGCYDDLLDSAELAADLLLALGAVAIFVLILCAVFGYVLWYFIRKERKIRPYDTSRSAHRTYREEPVTIRENHYAYHI